MKLALFGYGGHAREVAAQIGKPVTFYVDDQYVNDIAKPISKFNPQEVGLIVAVANSNDRKKIINNAIFNEDAKDMVIVRDIEFFSLCEHHLIPFFGRAHVGYLPNGKVVGLSKIPRIIDMFSRRLQVQERLTRQIAETVKDILDPVGVAVIMEGQHMCMQMRGVEKQNSWTTTSSMLGKFRESDRTRTEFLSIIGLNRT